ncbi:hypothetical protein L2E82_06313 [Cichorium intybus]|uniref:Uncharacterized protein n=1 Tax=Cichorium intybus TaxID=13427 RepID=A0ACB9HAF6_CICIN|nr:hypothetical protein L2E82_06313 [Cichorium intybus]
MKLLYWVVAKYSFIDEFENSKNNYESSLSFLLCVLLWNHERDCEINIHTYIYMQLHVYGLYIERENPIISCISISLTSRHALFLSPLSISHSLTLLFAF